MELNFVLEIPAIRLTAVEGLPTTVVAYTTDIPAFGGAWGQPLLFGPGTIHVAHTLDERVPKQQLLDAVEIYQKWSGSYKEATMNRIEVGILGATGMVGQHFIKFLDGHPLFQLSWLGASERSAGKRYADAAKWHLGGTAPASDRDPDGRRSEAGQRAEAPLLRDGCFRRDRNRTGLRAGRSRRRFELAEPSHGSRRAAARAGNQCRSSEARFRGQQTRARMEGADRDQPELLHRSC